MRNPLMTAKRLINHMKKLSYSNEEIKIVIGSLYEGGMTPEIQRQYLKSTLHIIQELWESCKDVCLTKQTMNIYIKWNIEPILEESD